MNTQHAQLKDPRYQVLQNGNKAHVWWSWENSLACELCSIAGCKKYSSSRASWDAGGVRLGINKQEVRRSLTVMNLPLALLHLHESCQSREDWLSLYLWSKFTGTENGRCKLSHLCPTDQQYRSYQTRNVPATLYLLGPHWWLGVGCPMAGYEVWKVGDVAEHMPRPVLRSWALHEGGIFGLKCVRQALWFFGCALPTAAIT